MFKKLKKRITNWMHPQDKCPADMLYHLLFGPSSNTMKIEDLESSCGLEIAKRPVQVGVIQIADNQADPEKLRMIIKYCSEASDSDELLPTSDGQNQVILLFFRDTLWEDQIREILEDTQKEFHAIWPKTRLYITLGTVEGYSEQGEPSWRKSLKTAIGLQDYHYVKPRGKIISYSDIVTRRQVYPKGIQFRFDVLKEYLEMDNPDLLRGWLTGIYSVLSGKEQDSLGIRYHLTLEIVVNTVSLLREKGLSAQSCIAPPEELVGEVLSINSQKGLQEWTQAFLEKCQKILQQTKAG